MKQIETNFLIYDLAKQAKYSNYMSLFKFFFAVFSMSGLFVMIYLLVVDLRLDLALMLNFKDINIFNTQLAMFTLSCVLGPYLLYKQTIPGQEFRLYVKFINAIFYTAWLAFAAYIGYYAYQEYLLNPIIVFDTNCIVRSAMAILFPMFIIVYYMQKGYTQCTGKTAWLMILTAFSYAGFINLFVCPENSIIHILFSHYLILLPMSIFMVLIARVIKK